MDDSAHLSRRERQIMDILYARGQATATDVRDDLPDPPSRTSVRTLLRILEEKGHLRHEKQGREFVYRPQRPRRRAGRSALQRVVATFFGGSTGRMVLEALDSGDLSDEEMREIHRLLKDKGNTP